MLLMFLKNLFFGGGFVAAQPFILELERLGAGEAIHKNPRNPRSAFLSPRHKTSMIPESRPGHHGWEVLGTAMHSV